VDAVSIATWRNRRTDRQIDQAEVDRLTWAWRAAAAGSGIGRTVPTVTGPTTSVPRLTSVTLGPPVVLMVQLLPGQLVADVRAASYRLAGALGAVALRIEARGLEYVRVELLAVDPLADVLRLDLDGLRGTPAVVLGRDEGGMDVTADVAAWPHVLLSGATLAGKTTGLRWVLAQLAHRRDVRVIGSDPSNSLWRPWPADPDRVSGLADIAAHVAMLERATAELDRRLATLPAGRDRVQTSAELPLWLIVMEEYAGALRVADADSKDMGRRLRTAMSRLLAESAKAGMRVWVLAQRGDTAILGGFERSNMTARITWATDREGVKMAHPGAPADLVDAHATAPPGIALLSAPGVDLTRLRTPLFEFAEYGAAVTAAWLPDLPA
jgi:S-DNA-T family DNA segregation ATPase FtsK/SpoIIIE